MVEARLARLDVAGSYYDSNRHRCLAEIGQVLSVTRFWNRA
jgi:hypothetical protein